MASREPTPNPSSVASETASATRGPRGRSTSTERARRLALLAGVVLLETIPVAALLETAATLQAGDPNQTAVTLWLLVVVTLLAVAVGRASARLDAGATILTALPVYLICLVILIRTSPAAYGPIAEGPFGTAWLLALGADLSNGASRFSAVFGLAILLGYLWWRGLRLGRTPTSIETTRTIFLFSFAALVLAVSVAAAVRGNGQQALTGRLEFLLPLDAFAGLAALSIARTNTLADDAHSVVWTGASERGTWLWLGLILSGATLVLASLVGLFASYDTVLAGLRDLGPLGELIGAGLQWLIFGILYLIYLVIGAPVDWIINTLRHNQSTLHIPQPPTPPKGACPNPTCLPHIEPAQGIAVAILLGAVLLVVVSVLFFVVYRAIKSLRDGASSIEQQQLEERESLDARGLFGAQLRGLLAGLRGTPDHAEEALPAGSARAIYRDILRVAAEAGHPRETSETPDEYRDRLERPTGDGGARASDAARHGHDADDPANDLATLTAAYARERYGDQPPAPAERRDLHARGRRIIARLRARAS